MKKKLVSMLLAVTMCLSLVACGNKESAAPAGAEAKETETIADAGSDAAAVASELVDGKFADTRKITVEIYDRGNDGGSDPTNNMYTDYIKKGMMDKYNVEVEFVAVPRWTEVEEINNLLAAGTAPDICITYDYATVQTYAGMDAVLDLSSYVNDYKDLLPELWNFLGETNINWDRDPSTGKIFALEGKRAVTNRCVTFVREDWLKKLNMKEPTTRQEFYDMLVAFKDNADTLLGADAGKLVPFTMGVDVGWRASTLIESFIDPDITDKEYYIHGFDERNLTQNGIKEPVSILNKWYNEGLIWNDFALHVDGDTTEDDMMKAGYVGAFIHNWDYPYRNGDDSIQANLQRLYGDDAKFVAVDCFEDLKGGYTKWSYSTAGDRKIFFPSTNEEPLASMLYLEYITSPEVIQYLQLGDEGVTHNVLDDGSYEMVAATGAPIMNSVNNIDMTITCNGLRLENEDITVKSIAHGYSKVDPELIIKSYNICNTQSKAAPNVQVPNIEAQEGVGPALIDKRNITYDKAVAASTSDFDSVWEESFNDYLSSGGQAIIDERTEKWNDTYGSAEMVPQ